MTYAVVAACAVAGVAILYVALAAKHEMNHPDPLVPWHLTGELTLGARTYHPDACLWGPIPGLETGQWLFESSPQNGGIALDESGDQVVIAAPGDLTRIEARWSRSNCSRFDVHLEKGARIKPDIDRPRFYKSGWIRLDCKQGDVEAHGDLAFDHCP